MRERSFINIEGRVRNHMTPFDNTPLRAIEPRHVREWVSALSEERSASTVRAIYQTFGQIMRTAEIDGLIVKSPCIGIELPSLTSREEMHFISPAQVRQLADEVPDQYRAAIYMAAYV